MLARSISSCARNCLVAVALVLVGCGTAKPSSSVGAAVSAKPQHTYTLTGVSGLIATVLADFYLQIDQTGDSTHGGNLQTFGNACVPATAAEQAACRGQCLDSAGGDATWLKRCTDACANLQDCTSGVCGSYFTYDYIHFGTTGFNKNCVNAGDTCPSCTPGKLAPALQDVDLTQFIPSPIFQKSVDLVGPIGCWVNTFGIDLRNVPGFNYTDWVSVDLPAAYYPYVLHVKGFASKPAVRCTVLDQSLNLINPKLDVRLTAIALEHHAVLDVVAKFTAHVDYAAGWVYDLDDTVNGKIDGALNGVLARNREKVNKKFEKLLFDRIKTATGEDVDDLRDVHFDGDSLVAIYTPSCVDGVCSCTPDCSNRQCGPDPHCNMECGPCRYGTCDPDAGVCQCTPTVTSCDGHCGTLSDGCGRTLYCPPCVCTPSCAGKACGASDGCRGSCFGYCRPKFSCQDDGGVKHCVYAAAD